MDFQRQLTGVLCIMVNIERQQAPVPKSGRHKMPLQQEASDLLGWHGPAQQITLDSAAALRSQRGELLGRLHPLRSHAKTQALGHAQDRIYDCVGSLVFTERLYK